MIRPVLLICLLISSWSAVLADSVTFRGVNHAANIKSVRIVDFPPVSYTTPASGQVLAESRQDPLKSFSLRFNLERPKPLQMKMLGLTLTLPVYPGDSIEFEITADGKMSFTGDRAAIYNYLALVKQSTDLSGNKLLNTEPENLEEYHNQVAKWFENRTTFLQEYSSANSLPAEFIASEQREVLAQKQFFLLGPLLDKFDRADLPPAYLSEIQPIDIDDIQSAHERYAMLLLSRQDMLDYKESESVRLANYRQGVADQKKILAMTNLIGYLVATALDENRSELETSVAFALEHVEDPLWRKHLETLASNLSQANNPLPKDVLEDTKLTNLDDSTKISLGELLQLHETSALYIDFWASWCLPCIDNIRNSSEVKAFLGEIGVPMIYISVDKNAVSWSNSAKKEAIEINQYLLEGGTESPLAKYLSVRAIPHYIILDRSHRLSEYDAPRPILSSLERLKAIFAEIDRQEKSAPKIISY